MTPTSTAAQVLAGLARRARLAGGLLPRPAPAPGAVAPGAPHRRRRSPSGCASCGYEVHDGVGGTGVVGVLRNGDGPDRAAARRHGRAAGAGGDRPAVRQHGHRDRRRRHRGAGDARLRSRRARHLPARRRRAAGRRRATHWTRHRWSRCSSRPRRLGDGARGMVDDGLADAGRHVDVALAQHVLPFPAGHGRHPRRPGPVGGRQHADHRARPRRARLDAAGRGRPGGARRDDRRPAADRRLPRGRARRARGADRRQHPGRHQEQRHPRPRRARSSTSAPTASRPATAILDAIRRIVTAECQASGSPEGPRVRAVRPLPAHRQRRRRHRTGRAPRSPTFFGDRRRHAAAADAPARTSATSRPRSACRTPTGASAASTPTPTARPSRPAGSPRTSRSTTPPRFAPVIQPTLDTGTQALVVAALAWLGK